MTKQEYIEWLAPRVVLDSLNRNLLPSPRIAQGCFEPAYGTSELAIFANNLFGVKNNDQWEGQIYNKDSGECYDGKNYVGKKSDFQKYDSWDDSIYWQGWYLENRCVSLKYHPEIKHFAELIGNRDYRDCARILKEKCYGTSPEYDKRVIDYIEMHDLTKYDSMTREEAEKLIGKEREESFMKINVHAGHNPDGKVACGAVGLIKESTEARKVKNEVISQLRQLGHTVYDCTVDNGTSVSDVLKKIVGKANSNNVDLDVSIHFNAGANDKTGNGKNTGTEVLIYSTSSRAKTYAINVCEAISNLGFKNRGVKTRSDLYVLKNTKAPAILIECCFVDDKDDVELYNYKEMASAIVYGITGKKVVEKEESNLSTGTEKNTVTGTGEKLYRVQCGAYKIKENAEALKRQLQADGYPAIIVNY